MSLLETIMFGGASGAKNPSSWLVDWVRGGSGTASGEKVNSNTAMSLGAYYACLRVLSEDEGKVPLYLYRRTGDRSKERVPKSDPFQRLISFAPNKMMSSQTFRETLTHWALGWGNGVAVIEWGRRAEVPTSLRPVEPWMMTIEDDGDEPVYIETLENGSTREYRPEQVIHIRGLGGRVSGYSVARFARETIGAGLAEIKSGAALFGNAMLPSGLIQSQSKMTPELKKNIREHFIDPFVGASKQRGVPILDNAMEYKTISVPNEDAQWIQSKQHTVEEICRWFRVAPHKVQHLLRSTFNNIEHSAKEHHTDTLLPWQIRWEQEIERKLLLGLDDFFVEHLNDVILRGDIKTRNESYAVGRQWGWWSANDVLSMENRNGIGEQGDVYLIPSNMVPADRINDVIDKQTAPAPAPIMPAVDDDDESNVEENAMAIRVRQLASDCRKSSSLDGLIDSYGPMFQDVFHRIRGVERRRTPDIETHRNCVAERLCVPAISFAKSAWSVVKGEPFPEMFEPIIELEVESLSQSYNIGDDVWQESISAIANKVRELFQATYD